MTFSGLRLNLTFALLQILVMTCWVVASVVCPGRMAQWLAHSQYTKLVGTQLYNGHLTETCCFGSSEPPTQRMRFSSWACPPWFGSVGLHFVHYEDDPLMVAPCDAFPAMAGTSLVLWSTWQLSPRLIPSSLWMPLFPWPQSLPMRPLWSPGSRRWSNHWQNVGSIGVHAGQILPKMEVKHKFGWVLLPSVS